MADRDPEIVVYLCHNCLPAGSRLPRQWTEGDARVLVREVPCSGKIDGQYLFHALEAGGRGLCVVTCPKGECHLSQGNYRAEIRIRTLQRLLAEIGLEPARVQLLRCAGDEPFEVLAQTVRDAVAHIAALGESPLRNEQPSLATSPGA